ncbi:hypothetical protein GQ55_9G553000 [Panicum hallii var. hallii]|uniref:Uncharacterized protein n=1 Tax=Panicum hallii var. hallii TaxID=1504633 RepID=A0A2T7CFE5_9POAL|nr:hypothetical protein GQ55_9G553000 [Panicum hallii var. hallii]
MWEHAGGLLCGRREVFLLFKCALRSIGKVRFCTRMCKGTLVLVARSGQQMEHFVPRKQKPGKPVANGAWQYASSQKSRLHGPKVLVLCNGEVCLHEQASAVRHCSGFIALPSIYCSPALIQAIRV